MLMESNNQNNTEIKRISILNKIKAKQLLLETIFPFTYNRPMIIPYLLEKDLLLENSMKNLYKSLKKNNKFSSETNQIFHTFIDFRKKYRENFAQKYLDDFGYIKSHLFDFKEGESLFQLYRHIFDDIFYHNFSKKQLNNFIIDYFHLCKNKKLFLILRSFSKHDDAANFLATLTESIVENFEIN